MTRVACDRLSSGTQEIASTTMDRASLNLSATLPAIQCLMPELLAYIFHLSLPDGNDFPNPLSKITASKFVSICRHWRHVALTTPLLWCRIYILNHLGSEDVENRYLRFVRLYMERSRDALISFTWHGKLQSEVVWELIKHKQRWKFVHITVNNANVLQVFTSAMAHGVPFLEVARIFSIYAPIYPQALCHAPNLVRLEIVHGFIGKVPEDMPEFKHLRHLRIGGHAKERNFLQNYHIPFIRRCPSLESLVVDFFDMAGRDAEDDSGDPLPNNLKIDLPFLTGLTIHVFFGRTSSSAHALLFLRHIQAPALCTLELMLAGNFAQHHQTQEHDLIVDSICEFLDRSGARVENFSVDTRTFDCDSFLRILQGMPTLKSLKIPYRLADDALMEALTLPLMTNGDGRGGGVCPKLADLKMLVDRRLSCLALETMIVSRCQPVFLHTQFSRSSPTNPSLSNSAPTLREIAITCLSTAQNFDPLKLNPIINSAISSGLSLQVFLLLSCAVQG